MLAVTFLLFLSCSTPSPYPRPLFVTGTSLPKLEGSWSFVVLPDTQGYVRYTPYLGIFQQQIDWIVRSQAGWDIRAVFHVGDVVWQNAAVFPPRANQSGTQQWVNARKVMEGLDLARIPYAISPGNHDYGWFNAENRWSQFSSDQFFGPNSPYGTQSTLVATLHGTENSAHLLDIGGKEFLVLAMEWSPRAGTVAWFDTIAKAYPDRHIIVLVHAYLNSSDERPSNSLAHYGTSRDPDGAYDAEQLWDTFIRRHPQMFLVLSGHRYGTGEGYLKSYGDHGNAVHQIFFNTQHIGDAGDGWLRIYEFNPSGLSILVRTYSPYLEQWRTGFLDQFIVPLPQNPNGLEITGREDLVESSAVFWDFDPDQNGHFLDSSRLNFGLDYEDKLGGRRDAGKVQSGIRFDKGMGGIAFGSWWVQASRYSSKLSVAMWLKPDFVEDGGWEGKQVLLAGESFELRLDQDLRLMYWNRNSGEELALATRLEAGQWQHLAVVRAGNQMEVYLDGSMADRRVLPDSDSMTIDRSSGLDSGFTLGPQLKAVIDDFGLWIDRALAPEEIPLLAGSSN